MGQFSVEICPEVGQFSMKLNTLPYSAQLRPRPRHPLLGFSLLSYPAGGRGRVPASCRGQTLHGGSGGQETGRTLRSNV
jgi:hypothetical protein